jgi:hypothetical protein
MKTHPHTQIHTHTPTPTHPHTHTPNTHHNHTMPQAGGAGGSEFGARDGVIDVARWLVSCRLEPRTGVCLCVCVCPLSRMLVGILSPGISNRCVLICLCVSVKSHAGWYPVVYVYALCIYIYVHIYYVYVYAHILCIYILTHTHTQTHTQTHTHKHLFDRILLKYKMAAHRFSVGDAVWSLSAMAASHAAN